MRGIERIFLELGPVHRRLDHHARGAPRIGLVIFGQQGGRLGAFVLGQVAQENPDPAVNLLRRITVDAPPLRYLGVAKGGNLLAPPLAVELPRSEEHTSELQSLMRISYAVFGLKKKKTRKHREEVNHS